MRKRCGFTLIEMLLATVLTSVLMVGVLAVITRVSRPISTPIHEVGLTSVSIGTDAIVRAVAADLAQARELEFTDGQIVMMGFCGLDPMTSGRNQRPVKVRYRVQSVADQSWLVREQRPLDVEGSGLVVAELVAPGVSRIALVPPSTALAEGLTSQDPQAERDIELPRDGRWRLRLWLEGQQGVVDRPVMLQRSLSQ